MIQVWKRSFTFVMPPSFNITADAALYAEKGARINMAGDDMIALDFPGKCNINDYPELFNCRSRR